MGVQLSNCSFTCNFGWWYTRDARPEEPKDFWVKACDREIKERIASRWGVILAQYEHDIRQSGDDVVLIMSGLVFRGFVERVATVGIDPRVDPVPIYVKALHLGKKSFETLEQCLSAFWVEAFLSWYPARGRIKPDFNRSIR